MHAFEEHTGEVKLRLEAPTFEALLVEAGRALAELLTDQPPGPLWPPERVAVTAVDRPALLVQWLDELIFLSDTNKRVYVDLAVRSAGEREVVADVRGFAPPIVKTQVKAATYHGLALEERPAGWVAEVVLDV